MEFIKTEIAGIWKKYLQNGDTVWYGKYRNFEGKSVRKKLGITKKKKSENTKSNIKDIVDCAVIFKELKEEKINYNNSNLVNNIEVQNYITINELSQKYFKDRIDTKRRQLREYYNHETELEFKENKLVNKKIKTIEAEIRKFKKNVGDYDIAKKNLNQIDKEDVKSYIEDNLGVLNISQKTKFMIISLIKTIINYGIKNDIIDIKNPFEHMKFKNPKRKRERVLNEEEIKLLLQECKKHNKDQISNITYKGGREVNFNLKKNFNIYLSVYLGVLTAARMGSILNIRKKDINIEEKTITLLNLKSDMKKYKVKLNDYSIKWLKEKILPYYENDEYLLRHSYAKKRENQPMAEIPKKVYKIMDELFNTGLNKNNNMERDNVCNFHSIRRSIGTNLVKNGTSVYNVMILLNHTNITQTMDYLNLSHNYLDTDLDNLMGSIFKDF